MTCWEILGITPDADKKAIKLAYAKRLKQTRPEDDPEGFKRLYEAYQQALDWQANGYYIAYDDEQTANDPDDSQPPAIAEPNEPSHIVVVSKTPLLNEIPPETKPILTELHLTPPLLQTAAEWQPEPPTTEYYLNQPVAPALPEPTLFNDDLKFDEDWQFFLKGCSTALHTEAARNDPRYWNFLNNIPSLTNLEFKEKVSLKLFSHIADANLIALEQKTLYIKPAVLNYLNEVFDWENQASYLTQHFSLTKVDAVLTYIDSQLAAMNLELVQKRIYPQANQELLLWRRLGAFVLDFLAAFTGMVIIIMLLSATKTLGISEVVESELMSWPGKLFVVYVLLVFPLLEAFYQASPGKKLLGLQVVNQYGGKIKWYNAIWRHWIVIMELMFHMLWIANLIMMWRRNLFLHDYFSRSYVVHRQSADFVN